MTYFEKNEQKHFFPMFSMLKAIVEISKVADFTTPCVNITNSAFSQLYVGGGSGVGPENGQGRQAPICVRLNTVSNSL